MFEDLQRPAFLWNTVESWRSLDATGGFSPINPVQLLILHSERIIHSLNITLLGQDVLPYRVNKRRNTNILHNRNGRQFISGEVRFHLDHLVHFVKLIVKPEHAKSLFDEWPVGERLWNEKTAYILEDVWSTVHGEEGSNTT
ncbi:hypothetical protein HG531_003942 [Fusarium graminearum]|nr:hypothetical protein HG531_003942 [Fusarium graminearum]